MSKKVCRFNEQWLNDDRFKAWLQKDKSVTSARCKLCSISFNLSNMGISAVISHSSGKKHLQNVEISKASFFKRKEAPQVHTCQPPQTKEVEPKETIESFIVSSNVLRAEILWALNVVKCHFSLRSCIGLNELFKVMFKDSDIAKDFKLGKTKCTYLINFGLAPYFKQELLNSIKASSHFVVSFDESLNRVVQDDQMDIQIRFWNESENVVSTRYLDSRFIKRPNAENLVTELNDSLSEFCLKNMIQLSMDGPNTNWKVLELLNDQRAESEIPQLLDIGSCGLHVIHGAFRTGVEATPWNMKKILKAMWQIFHDSPARRDIYIRETKSDVFSLRFVKDLIN